MMYVVSYSMQPPRETPPALITALQQQGEWCHYLDNTWLLSTTKSAGEIAVSLYSTIVITDRLLIVQVTAPAEIQGWLPAEAWNWFNERRFK